MNLGMNSNPMFVFFSFLYLKKKLQKKKRTNNITMMTKKNTYKRKKNKKQQGGKTMKEYLSSAYEFFTSFFMLLVPAKTARELGHISVEIQRNSNISVKQTINMVRASYTYISQITERGKDQKYNLSAIIIPSNIYFDYLQKKYEKHAHFVFQLPRQSKKQQFFYGIELDEQNINKHSNTLLLEEIRETVTKIAPTKQFIIIPILFIHQYKQISNQSVIIYRRNRNKYEWYNPVERNELRKCTSAIRNLLMDLNLEDKYPTKNNHVAFHHKFASNSSKNNLSLIWTFLIIEFCIHFPLIQEKVLIRISNHQNLEHVSYGYLSYIFENLKKKTYSSVHISQEEDSAAVIDDKVDIIFPSNVS
jgi:hypothetical protein